MTSQSEISAAATAGEADAIHTESAAFLRGFIGIAILLLIIKAAEPLFFGRGYFSTLSYHPFWIVVLLAAVQHGLFVGVATVGLATLMMEWTPRPVGVDITAHYVELAATPAQWLVVAVVVGLYRQAQIRRDLQIRRDRALLVEINDTLTGEIERLDAALARAELSAATGREVEGVSRPAFSHIAFDALVRLSDRADDLPEAFVAAAHACSDAGIAWVERSDTGFTLAAATDPDIAASAAEAFLAGDMSPEMLLDGMLASDSRHGLCVPITRAGQTEPIGAVITIADSTDQLSLLTSTVTLLARALEAATARLSVDAPPDGSEAASEGPAPDHG